MRLSILAAAMCVAAPLGAQDIAGTWQGTLSAFGLQYRQLIRVTKTAGGWAVIGYSLDDESDADTSSSIVLHGSHITITSRPQSPEDPGSTYEGELDHGAHTLTGTLSQADQHWPLTFRHVSPREAWPLPKPHTTRFVAVDTNVKLEVLDWGGSGPPVVFLAGLGNTRLTSSMDTHPSSRLGTTSTALHGAGSASPARRRRPTATTPPRDSVTTCWQCSTRCISPSPCSSGIRLPGRS
jgi:hypothetical protein